jgi:hypothetical protein
MLKLSMPDYQQPSNANVFDRKAKLLQRERAAQVGIFSVSVSSNFGIITNLAYFKSLNFEGYTK